MRDQLCILCPYSVNEQLIGIISRHLCIVCVTSSVLTPWILNLSSLFCISSPSPSLISAYVIIPSRCHVLSVRHLYFIGFVYACTRSTSLTRTYVCLAIHMFVCTCMDLRFYVWNPLRDLFEVHGFLGGECAVASVNPERNTRSGGGTLPGHMAAVCLGFTVDSRHVLLLL